MIFRSELYLKLRNDPRFDQFVEETVGPKTIFWSVRPPATGIIHSFHAKPLSLSNPFCCSIVEIPVIVNEPCHILGPARWSIVGILRDKHGTQWAVPFIELSVNTKN